MTVDELVENFEFFDDWEDRYAYLMELGDTLPALADDVKVPA
ncbi:MAG: SufE family protein, partial [Myxococcales bacterium]|nr:SufE family protein [Myxococcales bacterium]